MPYGLYRKQGLCIQLCARACAYVHQAVCVVWCIQQVVCVMRVCIRQCLYRVRGGTVGAVAPYGLLCTAGQGCVQQAAWAECMQSVWCCRRLEVGDSLPPRTRIPAQGWWPARAARQRWMWSLRNYPSAGQGREPGRDPTQALGLSPSSVSLPTLSPGSLSPVPTWPCCLLVTDQETTHSGHRGPGIQVPAWHAWSCPLRWGQALGRPAVRPVG